MDYSIDPRILDQNDEGIKDANQGTSNNSNISNKK